VEIELGNDAFGDAPEVEVGRILSRLAEHIASFGGDGGPIRDINGNTVGRWALDKEE
jgi:hypothetical protein